MEYKLLRKEILQFLITLQRKEFSYQAICDYINSQQNEFELFKDFFSRLQSKPNYYKSLSKQKKLTLIHLHVRDLFYKNVEEGDFTDDILRDFIFTASTEKFEAYVDVNRSEKSHEDSLAEFYLESSPAYLDVENNLKHKRQYEWELDIHNYGSTFEILSVETNSLFTNSAVVTSKEFWKLFWKDKTSKKLQFKFESLGETTYLLTKNKEGKWRIIENMTKAPSNSMEPEYVDQEILTKLCSKHQEENKIIVSKFLANDDILHCIAFMKISFFDKLKQHQASILDRIKESCLNSHRLLNTGAINFAMFKAEIELLTTQTRLVCNSIFLTTK